MCVYFYNRFIDYVLGSKTLIDYTDFFLLQDFKKNDKKILNCIRNR